MDLYQFSKFRLKILAEALAKPYPLGYMAICFYSESSVAGY